MEPEETAENSQGIGNNEPKHNLLKNLFIKFKGIFKNAFFRIRGLWLIIPKKIRLVLIAFFTIVMVLVGYTLFSQKINLVKRITERSVLDQFNEGWEKLKIPEREPSFFTLKSTTQSKYGILLKETFVLAARESVDLGFLENNLKSSIPVEISPVSSTEFKITAQGSLGNDQLVSLSLPVKNIEANGHTFDRNYGWTFQTQGKFRVKTGIPGDKKTNVPLKTGIEITFSQDDFKDPTNLINIEPAIEWRAERHGETFAIVPLKPLRPKTLYTVSLRKGLNLDSRNDPISEDYSFSFQTQEEESFNNKVRPPRISLSKNFIQSAVNEAPAVTIFSSNWKDDLNLKTKIYKFSDIDKFIESRKKIDEISSSWYSYFAEDEAADVDSLAKVTEIDLKVQKKDNVEFIQLPQPLSGGFYLIQFWYEDGKKLEQLWVQSTNISGYTSVGKVHTLVWINDVESGDSVKEAQVQPVGLGTSFSTNDVGIAVFSTPQVFHEKSLHYIKVSTGNGDLALPVNSLGSNAKESQKESNDYWSYLYHERILYKPGDTVYFWGAVKERDTGSVPASIKVSISAGYYYSYSPSETSGLASVNITPNSDGSFIGNIPLANIPQGSYSLILKVNDLQVNQGGFQITEYKKPEMKLEVTSSKNAVFTGEKVDFTAKVSFFDGTPAKQIPLKIHESRGGKVSEVTTDQKGQITYAYEPKYDGNENYYPRYESITINPALAESSEIEGFGSVFVYGAKLMITTISRQEGDKAFLTAKLNKVNLDNINQGKSFDVKGESVANKEVSMNITKTWWEKIEIGTYYDFIEKTTRPSYRYQRHDDKVLDTKLKTNDKGEISYEFNMENKKSYQVTLSLEDEDKHPVTAKVYYYYYEGHQNYSSDEFAQPELTLDSKENNFSVGDNVNLKIKYKGEDYKDTDKNRFLFILAQRGRQDFFVEDQANFSFAFADKHIPNTYAAAIIFTGKYYQVASPYCQWEWSCSYYSYYYEDYYFNSLEVRYREGDSKLDLSISKDIEKYKPGDKAKISIKVSKNDQPVSDSEVNLVLVDQALAAIGGVIKPDILAKLYTSVPNGIYYNYYSHKPVFPKPPAAERGGGGGDERQVFKDTSFFGRAKTDGEGNATFEFTLPDNITTWIVYAQAVNSNLDAGQAEGKLVATKDFFVTSNFPAEFLQKDKAYISGNGFGVKVSPNQPISYEVAFLQGDSELQKLKGQGPASKDTVFEFPGLSVGDYKVWLKGAIGGLTDGVIYPFKVIDSRLDLKMSKKFRLEKGQNVNSLDLPGVNEEKPVKLVISDIGRGVYYSQLYNFCFTSSNRLEKRLAQKKANATLLERFNEEPCSVKDDEISVFQNIDGGLSQVSWGGSVLETTVWALHVDAEVFDKEKLATYLEQKLIQGNSGNIQKIYAAWGLTLVGKPHLNDLLTLAQTSVGFDDKVIVALALADTGNLETAREIYYDLLADYGYTYKPYIRIQSNPQKDQQTSVDKYVEDTGLTLLLGSMTEKNYNDGLFYYIRDYQNQVDDIVLDLGKISFINEELGKLPSEDTKLTFKSASREQSFDLSKGGKVSLTLLEGEFKSTIISLNSGKAEINSYYFAMPDILSQIPNDQRLILKRTLKKAKGEGSSIRPGDIVEIKVDFDLDKDKAPLGGYSITDHLPSGLVFIDNPQMYGFKHSGWVRQDKPNVIKYTFYNSPWWQKYGDRTFKYYARAGSVGTYIAEPVIMQSYLDLGVIQTTPEDSIKIEASN